MLAGLLTCGLLLAALGGQAATALAAPEATFPYTGGAPCNTTLQACLVGMPDGGFKDAFVVKVDAGGSDNDQGIGVALGSSGNAFITGQTFSDQTSFPVTTGPGRTYSGNGDIFMAEIVSFVPSAFLCFSLVQR